MTRVEAIDTLAGYSPDNQPLIDGYDPYNSADHIWWRWLYALRTLGGEGKA